METQNELLKEFRIVGSRGIQCESEAMDSEGNLYCSLISSSALIAWKEDSDYDSDHLKVIERKVGELKATKNPLNITNYT